MKLGETEVERRQPDRQKKKKPQEIQKVSGNWGTEKETDREKSEKK